MSDARDLEDLSRYVQLAQKGDEQGFALLIDATQDSLFRFCFYLSGNRQLAEDLCQECFVRALEQIKSLKDPASFKGWLLRMAKNLFLDHVRSPRNRPSDPVETLDEGAEQAQRTESMPVAELSLQVRQALESLAPEERLSILLVDLEGQSYAEAAEVIGITEEALRSRLHRARKAFVKNFSRP